MVSQIHFALLLCSNQLKWAVAVVGQKYVCELRYHRSHVLHKNSNLIKKGEWTNWAIKKMLWFLTISFSIIHHNKSPYISTTIFPTNPHTFCSMIGHPSLSHIVIPGIHCCHMLLLPVTLVCCPCSLLLRPSILPVAVTRHWCPSLLSVAVICCWSPLLSLLAAVKVAIVTVLVSTTHHCCCCMM